MTRTLLALAALCLAAAPAFAHGDGEACKEHHAAMKEHHKDKAAKGEKEADAPRSFASKPKAGTMAKCPVSGEVFKVGKKTKMVEHAGRWYAFCCPDCDGDFAKEPGKYADPAKS